MKENDFLQNLAELIGEYDRETTSASYNRGIRSTSTALKREKILTVDELGAMPRGRAIMLATGTRAALLRTIPWYAGPKDQVARINASIAAHDPAITPVGTESLRPSSLQAVSPPISPGEMPSLIQSCEGATLLDAVGRVACQDEGSRDDG